MNRLNLQLTLAVALIVLFTGCVSKESVKLVQGYAKSSATVQQDVLDVYDETIQARHNAKLMTAVKDGAFIKGVVPDEIEHSGQVKALSSLLAFSEAVYALASDDTGEDIDKYTEKLNGSLSSMSDNPKLPEQYKVDTTLISTGVNAISRAYTEYSRYKALKKVMIESNATITGTIDLLRKDLPSWKEATRVSLQKELNIRMFLLNNPNRCTDNPETTCETYVHTIEEKRDAYKKASDIKIRLTQLNNHFKALDKALAAIANLHNAIIVSLESDNDVNIASAKKAYKAAKVQIDAIKDFKNEIKE